MQTPQSLVKRSVSLLRYSYGAVLLLIGLDKIFGTYYIVNWNQYVSELALSALPFTGETFVLLLGIAEVVVGGLMLSRFTRVAAVLVIATLVAIIINLFSLGLYDIAARDALIAVGALVLIWLTDAQRSLTHGS